MACAVLGSTLGYFLIYQPAYLATASAQAVSVATTEATFTAAVLPTSAALPTTTALATTTAVPTVARTPAAATTSTPTIVPTLTPAPSDTVQPTGTPPPTANTGPTDTVAPEATPTTTHTVTPAITETPSPTPSATRLPSPVAFQGVTDRKGPAGTFHVLGEVVNGSGQAIEFVEVVGSFFDADGELVEKEFTYALLEVMDPGETAPFELVLMEPASGIDHYELEALYDPTDVQPMRVDVVSQDASWSTEGTYDIVGEVRNPHDADLEYVQIVATCYDSAGGVVAADFAFVESDVMEPGQTEPFEIIMAGAPGNLERCDLKTLAVEEGP